MDEETIRQDGYNYTIQLRFACHSTAIRPRYDHMTAYVTTIDLYLCVGCCTEASINKHVSMTAASGSAARDVLRRCDLSDVRPAVISLIEIELNSTRSRNHSITPAQLMTSASGRVSGRKKIASRCPPIVSLQSEEMSATG